MPPAFYDCQCSGIQLPGVSRPCPGCLRNDERRHPSEPRQLQRGDEEPGPVVGELVMLGTVTYRIDAVGADGFVHAVYRDTGALNCRVSQLRRWGSNGGWWVHGG